MPKPNLIYILADDMGYGDVKHLNKDCKIPTPHLDRLGREGMSFSDAHSSSSVCTPSRYSILTGKYCWRTYLKKGVLSATSDSLLEKGELTLASMLKGSDYKTACIGKWHLGWKWAVKEGVEKTDENDLDGKKEWIDYTKPIEDGPIDCGFEEFYGICGSLDMPPYIYVDGNMPVGEATDWGTAEEFYRAGPREPSFRAQNMLGEITDKALEYIEKQTEENPFFLYFPLNAPHTPIKPANEFIGKSGLGEYGDFCMEVDHRVGQIIDKCVELGIDKDTMIVFTTDNGASPMCDPYTLIEKHDHYCSHIYRGYKSDIWDGGHRIPFMVRWPNGIEANSWKNEPIGIFDMIATMSEVCDIPLAKTEAFDAVSFAPCFKNEKPMKRLLVNHSIDGMFALRDGDWKLCRCSGSGGWSTPTDKEAVDKSFPDVQLYNLADDPEEKNNIAAENGERVQSMTIALHQLVRRSIKKDEDWNQINWLPEIPEKYILND